MASRCFVHNNLQSTVRGYLAAIIFSHKMFGGWELRMSHSIIVAVGKGIDRAQGMAGKKRQVRLPLTWATLARGRQVVTSMEDGGHAMWLGLAVAVSYVLWCRASEMWAYPKGQVHPEFLPDAELPCFLSRRSAGELREQIDRHSRAGNFFGVEG